MRVITTIAYRAGVIAADTQMIQGTSIIGHVTKIVRRDDGALCGGAGDLAWVQAFHRWFLDGCDGDPPRFDDDCSKGLIIRRRKPIEIFESCGAFEFRPAFVAIGSGKEFALGAMQVGASAKQAVKAAMAFDPGSGGTVMALSHD